MSSHATQVFEFVTTFSNSERILSWENVVSERITNNKQKAMVKKVLAQKN